MNLSPVLLLLSCVAPQDIPERPEDLKYAPLKFDVPDAEKMRAPLRNGAAAYVIEDRSLPKVEITVQVRAGSFWEDAGKEGLAGLCGTLMRLGGTKTRRPADLDEELDFLAAELNVSVGDTSGSASLSVLSKDLDKGLEILFDVLRNPAFDPEKLDLVKAQTMERLKSRNDSTASIEARETNLLLYGDYPLNKLSTGASIESITREDLVRFHARFFRPWNFIIAAAGDFDRAVLIEKLDRALEAYEIPKAVPERPRVPPVTYAPEPGIYCFHKDGKNINQGRVSAAHLGVELHHPDVFPLRVLGYILGGGGFSSRLVQRVRTEMGLAYEVHADLRPGILYVGSMRMAFQSKNETCALALKTCLEEMERIRREGVSEEELAAAKQYFLDAFPGLFFPGPARTAGTFAFAELHDYPKGYFQSYRERIAAVTREDVRRVAEERLHPDQLVIVVVGNISEIKQGDGRTRLADLGRPIVDVPLPDPVTLARPVKDRKGGFCPRCRDLMFTADIGTCVACGSDTSSGGMKLCAGCARAKGVCQACGE
ncbi:MAG: insulinase family protein [Planctomycetes bacterium]|nr:insulinase family protein [Planctomycetota bacterium]